MKISSKEGFQLDGTFVLGEPGARAAYEGAPVTVTLNGNTALWLDEESVPGITMPVLAASWTLTDNNGEEANAVLGLRIGFDLDEGTFGVFQVFTIPGIVENVRRVLTFDDLAINKLPWPGAGWLSGVVVGSDAPDEPATVEYCTVENEGLPLLSQLGAAPTFLALPVTSIDAVGDKDADNVLHGDGVWAPAAYIGEVRMFATSNLPDGWLPCDGLAYNQATYPLLYAAIGDAFGTPPAPPLQFRVPNMKYSFPIGTGPLVIGVPNTSLGTRGGALNVTLTQANLPSHTHDLGDGVDATTTIELALNDSRDQANTLTSLRRTHGEGTSSWHVGLQLGYEQNHVTTTVTGTTDAVGAGAPFDIVPPYVALNFAIYAGKAVGGGGSVSV